MELKELDRIESQLKDILKKRNDRINELNQVISEQKQKKEEAEKGLKEVKDLETYKASKEQIRSAEDTIEFCNIEIKRLEARKDVSEDDAKQIKTIIGKIQKETNDSFDESAKKIINELQSLVSEYRVINGRINQSRELLFDHVAMIGIKPPMESQVSKWFSYIDNFVTRLEGAIKYKYLSK